MSGRADPMPGPAHRVSDGGDAVPAAGDALSGDANPVSAGAYGLPAAPHGMRGRGDRLSARGNAMPGGRDVLPAGPDPMWLTVLHPGARLPGAGFGRKALAPVLGDQSPDPRARAVVRTPAPPPSLPPPKRRGISAVRPIGLGPTGRRFGEVSRPRFAGTAAGPKPALVGRSPGLDCLPGSLGRGNGFRASLRGQSAGTRKCPVRPPAQAARRFSQWPPGVRRAPLPTGGTA